MSKKQELRDKLAELQATEVKNTQTANEILNKVFCEGIIPTAQNFSTIEYAAPDVRNTVEGREVYNNLKLIFGDDVLILQNQGLMYIDIILRMKTHEFSAFKHTVDLLVQEQIKRGTVIKEHVTIPNVGDVVYVRPPWSWNKEDIIKTKVTLAGTDSFIAGVNKDMFEGIIKLLTLTDYGVLWSLNKKVLEDYIDKVKSEQ